MKYFQKKNREVGVFLPFKRNDNLKSKIQKSLQVFFENISQI